MKRFRWSMCLTGRARRICQSLLSRRRSLLSPPPGLLKRLISAHILGLPAMTQPSKLINTFTGCGMQLTRPRATASFPHSWLHVGGQRHAPRAANRGRHVIYLKHRADCGDFIAQRPLPMTTRRVLIMIDGKRTVDDLSILAKPGELRMRLPAWKAPA